MRRVPSMLQVPKRYHRIFEPHVFIAQSDGPMPIQGVLPPGEGWIEIKATNFKPNSDLYNRLEEMRKVYTCTNTDADMFDQYVRQVHKVPQDADTWKAFGVTSVRYAYDPSGHYKLDALAFRDGTIYEAGMQNG